MAEIIEIGHKQDSVDRGDKSLNTGSMRRTYSKKKKKKNPKIRICNNKYTEGK
tara:strand:+ start:186 stop:344 length:159 start_codon:yes stop_codon:yes gene_type:complete